MSDAVNQTPIDVSTIFDRGIAPAVALRICDRYARTLIALDDEGGPVPVEDQEIFAAMLAEAFSFEATRTYLTENPHGPILEWMTRFPSALEDMLHRFVAEP